ncbi:MAG: SBBP repeat-containing protein [Ignavibacteria bacterium]|jgi:uncharacterized delta-60 repeat protein
MKKLLLLTVFCISHFICINEVFAQPQWIHTSGGPLEDKAYAIVVDKAGYSYVTGYTTTTNQGTNWYTIKYKSDGTVRWSAYYDGPAHSEDKAYAIAVDKSNNVYVAGYSTGIGSGHDFTTIKYNSSGSQQWVQRYNAPSNSDDEAHALVLDDSSNIYVTGFIAGWETDYYTIKYNSNGICQWGKLYNGPGSGEDKAYAITLDRNSNVYITGWSEGNGTGFDYATIKYNRSGTQQWVTRYNGPGNAEDKAYAIVVDANGDNIYVTGYSTGVYSSFDYATIKYKTDNGESLWTARYNGPGNSEDKAYAITMDGNNNVYVTGSSRNGTTEGSEDYFTIKYNCFGDSIWTARFNGTGNSTDIAYSLYIPKTNHNLFVAGSIRSGSVSGTEDIGILKYGLISGNLIQQVRYNGTANDEDAAYDIFVDSLDNVFIAGYTTSLNTGKDYIAMKYANGDLVIVNILSTGVPKDFVLHQNYPNPFNPSTTIVFEIPSSSNVKLVIYDMLGKEDIVLVNGYLRAGIYQVSLSMTTLSSGVYFYSLTADGYKNVKKMILLK